MAQNQVQAQFFTKQKKYGLPDTPYSLPSQIKPEGLNELINKILKESRDEEWIDVEFDFLLDGEFLTSSLEEVIQVKSISPEASLNIEYAERFPAPEPEETLNHDDWVSAAHCVDGWILSGCYDSTVHLWSSSGAHHATIPGHNGPVKGVRWISLSDNKGTFVSASHDQTVMVWAVDLHTLAVKCVQVGRGHERSVECVDVDSSSSMIATGGWDKYLKIWGADIDNAENMETDEAESDKSKVKTPIMTLHGHKEAISSLAWIENHEIVSCSWDHTIKVWDAELGGIKSEFVGNKSFFSLAWSPLSNCVITSSADRHIRLYDLRSQEGSLVKTTFTSHNGWVSSVSWSTSNQNHFISGGHDSILKMWDCRSPNVPLYDMAGHTDKILCCNWSSGKEIVSGGADNSLRIFVSQQK